MFSQRLARMFMPPVTMSKRLALRPGMRPPHSVCTGSMFSKPIVLRTPIV